MSLNGNSITPLPTGQNGRSPTNKPTNGSAVPVADALYDDDLQVSAEVAAIWQQRAAELATPPDAQPESATLDILVFSLGGKRYGIKVEHVREIYPPKQITPVPRTPDFVVGVFSARGRLLSVIDLHAYLGLPKVSLAHNSKIIVVNRQGNTCSSSDLFEVGILADEVEDVLTIFEDELTSMLSSQGDNQADYTLGVTAEMLVVLNLEVLLQHKRLIVHEEL